MHGRWGRCIPWVVAFLVIFVLLMLLVTQINGTTGLFGRYTPWVIAFLIIYVLLMFLVNHPKIFNRVQ